MNKLYLIPFFLLFIISIGFSSDLTDLQGNLTNCYSFDELEGNLVYDSKFLINGTNYNGNILINQEGKQDKSYYLNGTTLNYINWGVSKLQLNTRTNWSVNVWIKPEYLNANRMILGSKQIGNTYNSQFYLNTQNKIVFSQYIAYTMSITCNDVLNNNTWYMITLTNIKSTTTKTLKGFMKIYINGTECSSYSYVDASNRYDATWGGNTTTGIYNWETPTSPFKGYIDTMSFYLTKNLTSSNINYLYNNYKGLRCDFTEPVPNNNATSYNFTNYRELIQYNYNYPILINALNDSGSIVEQRSNLLINNLSLNENFTSNYVKNVLFNNISSNFYVINITNVFNDSIYLETNVSTYRLLTNFTIGEDIVHYPLYIDFNMTFNLSDNSIENITTLINVSVYNINNSVQSYFNLTRVQGENGGESYGEYVFKGIDVGSCLNFSYTMTEYDSTFNSTIVCDEHKFTYFYMLYYMGTLSNKIDSLTSTIGNYFNNLTILILGVNNSLYNKLDNLNISGGSASLNQSTLDDISLIKKIQICWFKQYEQIEDYYTYCLDYHNPFNITEQEQNENIALNLTAYWLNKSLAEEESKEFNPENCYNLNKYKSLLNLTDYFGLNVLLTSGSFMIDNSFCWLKLGYKAITGAKV